MAHKKERRGISFGTIFVAVLCLATAVVAGGVFLRISGDMGEVRIDPKMLTEPLNVIARTVSEAEISAGGAALPSPDNAPPVAAATATPEPTQPPSRSFSLTAVGQISMGDELRKSGREGDVYSYDQVIAPVAPAMGGADLSIATLRSGLTGDASAYSASRAPAELAMALKGAGVNLINLSTDKLLDNGVEGVSETRAVLRDQGISAAGAYSNEEERSRLTIRDIDGVNVGVLSFTSAISTTGRKAASEAEIHMSTRVLEDVASATADIAALRAQGADIILVLVHWGGRADASPSEQTYQLADAFVNAGADIILGTNPTRVHEIQRRTVTDAATGQAREVFIAYSLGNFLMDESRDTSDITGIVLHLAVDWDAQTQRATYRDTWYMPTWIMRYKDSGNVNRYRVVPSGTLTVPDHMTDSIYVNMQKSHQGIVTRLGNTFALPKVDP